LNQAHEYDELEELGRQMADKWFVHDSPEPNLVRLGGAAKLENETNESTKC
jgi:hypothetical protein